MTVVPIFQRQAFEFITNVHRHHIKPVGSIFQIGLAIQSQNDVFETKTKLVGVAVVGRPVARKIQDV